MNFFDNLISYIELFWSWFLSTLNTISTAVSLVRQSVLHVVDIMGFYPTILSASAIIVVAIIVVKFILGR